jgi:hypothetical protein
VSGHWDCPGQGGRQPAGTFRGLGRGDSGGKSELLHSIHERIVVRGSEVVGARLTPEPDSLGLALASPKRVQPAQEWLLARPTGFNRVDARIRIPIAWAGRTAMATA